MKKSGFIILAICLLGLAYLLLSKGDRNQLNSSSTASSNSSSGEVNQQGQSGSNESAVNEAGVESSVELTELSVDQKTAFQTARQASIKGKFNVAREELHTLLVEKPELVRQVITDNGFRKFRETDDFRKLLLILDKDPHQELGLPPIHLE